MGRKSELVTKHTRVRALVHELSDADIAELCSDFETSRKDADDWTSRCDSGFKAITAIGGDYESWYETVYRKIDPKAPTDPWLTATGAELGDRITRFLHFRLKHSRGFSPDGKVMAATLFRWAKHCLVNAVMNIRGPIGIERKRSTVSLTGTPGHPETGAWHIVRVWCESEADRRDLPRHARRMECFGRYETAIVLDHLDEQIKTDFRRAELYVQKKSILQLVFLTGLRAGSFCRPGVQTASNLKKTLLMNRIEIKQVERYVYEAVPCIRYAKGFNGTSDRGADFRPTIPIVQRIQNVRYDWTTTLVPLLIHAGALHYRTAQGQDVPVTSLEAFFDSESTRFFVPEKIDNPLFRQFDTVTNRLKAASPLTTIDAAKQFNGACQDAGLPGGRLHDIRHNLGDATMIAAGSEAQKAALLHTFGDRFEVGRRHYSNADMDVRAGRFVIHEFGPGDTEAEARMKDSGFYARERNGNAVKLFTRRVIEGETKPQERKAGGSLGTKTRVPRAELDAACEANPEYVRCRDLHKSLRRQKHADPHEVNAYHRQCEKIRRNTRKRLARAMQKERRVQREAIPGSDLDALKLAQQNAEDMLENDACIEQRWKDRSPSVNDAVQDLERSDGDVMNVDTPDPSMETGLFADDGQPIYYVEEDDNSPDTWESDDDDCEIIEEPELAEPDRPFAMDVHAGNRVWNKMRAGETRFTFKVAANVTEDADTEDNDPTENPTFDESHDALLDSRGLPSRSDDLTDDAVVNERIARMRFHYEAMTNKYDVKASLRQHIAEQGWCPFCELGEVNAVQYHPSKFGRMVFGDQLCGSSAVSTVQAFRLHVQSRHPGLWPVLEANELPPRRSELWDVELSEQETCDWFDIVNTAMCDDRTELSTITEHDIDVFHQLIGVA